MKEVTYPTLKSNIKTFINIIQISTKKTRHFKINYNYNKMHITHNLKLKLNLHESTTSQLNFILFIFCKNRLSL